MAFLARRDYGMADDDKIKEGTSSRGNEWEVVSPTASTYSTESGTKHIGLTDGRKELAIDKVDFSRSMFMSGHFVFPPSEHENLPLDPDTYEAQPKVEAEVPQGHSLEQEACGPDKNQEEIWSSESLPESGEIQVELLEKGKKVFPRDVGIEESRVLQGANIAKEVQDIYGNPGCSPFHGSAGITEDAVYEDVLGDEQPDDHYSKHNLDASKSIKASKEVKGHQLPSETWWKRQAASLYSQAKEVNTFWSIFVAAALVGIVILGQRWQQERWQLQQLKWKMTDEMKTYRVLGTLNRFKDVFIGSSRRGIEGISSAER